MSVALFVPCYIDQFYPDVAVATLELLERQGLDVVYPAGQTCCGQPMANTGCTEQAAPVARRLVNLFAEYDQVVCPSGSCTAMVRHHYADYFPPGDAKYEKVRASTYELCEFLTDVVGVRSLGTRFPHRISVHQSCHGLRELRLADSSETRNPGGRDKMRELLQAVEGISWAVPQRSDECCGFGGTFAVNEADVSVAMGRDRIEDHLAAGSEVIVAGDMSCLMHLQGLIRRSGTPLAVMHIAQVLMGRPLPTAAADGSSAPQTITQHYALAEKGSDPLRPRRFIADFPWPPKGQTPFQTKPRRKDHAQNVSLLASAGRCFAARAPGKHRRDLRRAQARAGPPVDGPRLCRQRPADPLARWRAVVCPQQT